MSANRIGAFLDEGSEAGCVDLSELNELVETLELDDEEVERVCEQLAARDIEVRDDCGRRRDESTYVNGDLAVATTDALQLFLNEMARHPLLTADQEVEL